MDQGTITCPHCGQSFELSDALTHQIREHLKVELQAELVKREADAKRRSEELKAREEALAKAREGLNDEVEKQLKQKLTEAEARAAKKVEGRFADQLKEMQDSMREKDESLKAFRQNELELRKQKQALEKEKEEFDLRLQRKLDEERASIRKEAEGKASEQFRLKDLEKDKVIGDLKSALDDMKRKAEQGSMETQGEVLEQDFEARLRGFFLHDEIQPVAKGIRGADLIQSVRTPHGTSCGSLLWEMKNTKAWNGQWIPKLKDDMIETRATIAVLVSVVLPEGVNRFGMVEGVWVSDPLSAIPLAAALRQQLLALDRERKSSEGKSGKMEMLYHYLAGTEFSQKIGGIVEAFTAMQDQVNRERRAMEKNWKEREKQIERVIKNTTGLYGDMQGIIGGVIPQIPALELGTPAPHALPDHEDEKDDARN
ncbi:MAG: DUF2130 domain-containing protein [Chthoniobacteraceae bacterium]